MQSVSRRTGWRRASFFYGGRFPERTGCSGDVSSPVLGHGKSRRSRSRGIAATGVREATGFEVAVRLKVGACRTTNEKVAPAGRGPAKTAVCAGRRPVRESTGWSPISSLKANYSSSLPAVGRLSHPALRDHHRPAAQRSPMLQSSGDGTLWLTGRKSPGMLERPRARTC